MIDVRHVFCACQAGAEQPLKREAEARAPAWRFAFSRPGFVTFKLLEPTPLDRLQPARLTFARTLGGSLGRVSGSEDLERLAEEVWRLEPVAALSSAGGIPPVHVWQRDAALPGDHGFEPGPTPLSETVHEAVVAAAPAFSSEGGRAAVALDVTVVEPNEWWVGCHRLKSRVDRWPGGTPPLGLPEHAVSRAYLKMREALAWGRVPCSRGDEWIELGCAPGGASQALLDEGMYVLGVDPADVEPGVVEHPRFCHLKMRAADARRREFIDARWLAADINAAPQYTLDAVEPIVTHASVKIRGLVLTLKLPTWEVATPEKMAEYLERIRGWGYRDLRARQLAFNRRELCVVALRSRGQRRLRR